MPRIPSDRNPFKMPDELRGFPVLYRALIRPIREADMNGGREFVKRFLTGPQEVYEDIADAVASVWDILDPELCPDDLLQYLKDLVGFDKDFDYITDRLSFEDLRKLIKLAVPLWKERFSGTGIVNLIRLLTGRNAILYDWFHYRAIIGETFLSEEQLGYDFWLIGGDASHQGEFWMQVRLMDDGTVDELLVLDLLSLERVASERIEVALVDFLDQFDLDRDKWETLAGTPASVETDKTFKIPTGTSERPLLACETFSDYAVLQRFFLPTAGAIFNSFFYVEDWVAGNYYRVQVGENSVELAVYIGGSPTVIGLATFPGTLAFPIFTGLWYKLRLSAVSEGVATRVKVYVDGNEVFNALDSGAFEYGEVVLGAEGTDHVFVDNVEIFRVPLRLATIEPSGTVQSANFIWDKVCPLLPPPPADLLVYAKWNGGLLDEDVLAFSTCEYEYSPSFRVYVDYCLHGGREYAEDNNGATLALTGQKFGVACFDLTGAGDKFYQFQDYNGRGHNAQTNLGIGGMSAWIKPDYSGTPAVSVGFFSWGNPAGTVPNNGIAIYQDATSGKLSASFWDGSGILIGTIQTDAAWVPVSGTWYHIEFGFDFDSGQQYLFVDGALVASGTFTGTRTSAQSNYSLAGRILNVSPTYGGPHVSDHYVDDFVFYDVVPHTADFAVPTTSIRDSLASPFRLFYLKGGGCTLGHSESAAVDTNTRLAIDATTQKLGAGALDLSNDFTAAQLRHHGAGVIDGLGDEGTISFWVKVQDNTPSDENVFVGIFKRPFGPLGGEGQIVISHVLGGGNLRVDISTSTGAGWVDYQTPFVPTVGVWYHIEVAFDTSVPRLLVFIDGSKDVDFAGAIGTRGTGAECLMIGNYNVGGSAFVQFELDDLRIYNVIKNTASFTPPTSELLFSP